MYYKRLRELREDKDKYQKEIADVLQITTQQYQLYESGKRTLLINLLKELCRYYDVSADYILELRLTGVEHITVSLVALFRAASHSFLKGVSLPANSCFAARKIRRQKLSDLPNREFFALTQLKNAGILAYFK